jgi:hypothetical protein
VRAGWRSAGSAGLRRDLRRTSDPALRSSQRTRNRGSAGCPPEQLLDTPALSLGRTARAAVADSHRGNLLTGRKGRAIVDIALDSNRCADTLGDDPLDDHDAFASFGAQPHLITGLHGMRGLDPYPVDPDVPGSAGTGGGRAGAGQPHRPDPAIYPPSLITCHSANCNAIRARWLRQTGVFCGGPRQFTQRGRCELRCARRASGHRLTPVPGRRTHGQQAGVPSASA